MCAGARSQPPARVISSVAEYVRDGWLGTLHKLGVEWIPMTRLYGVDEDSAYFQHTVNGEAIVAAGIDTLVLAMGHEADRSLADTLEDWPGELHAIGDALSPRTAEEAVLEGLKVGSRL